MGTLVMTQVRYAEVAAVGIVSFYCSETFSTEPEAIKSLAESIQKAYQGSCHPKYSPYTNKKFIRHVERMNTWDNQDSYPYEDNIWVTVTLATDLVRLIKEGHELFLLEENAEVQILEALGLPSN